MRFKFEDDDLRRLYTEPGFRVPRFGSNLTKQYRKKMQILEAAKDERDLYTLRGLRFEKLMGDRAGQHSMRLNEQFRLILRLTTDDDGRLVIIVEIIDYH